jgi:hypothetical protein
VGHFLPQEELDCERIFFSGIELRIQEDESQGTRKPVGHCRTSVDAQVSLPHFNFSPKNLSLFPTR